MEEKTVISAENEQETTPRSASRHKRRTAAKVTGIIVVLLCAAGIAFGVFGGVKWIQKLNDTSALKEEFYYFLEPLMYYNPEPFEDTSVTEQDAFLNAAAYRIMRAEQIRMLRENDENCLYAVDDLGRLVVSVSEVEESYNTLFGAQSTLTHHTLSDDGLMYSSNDACYYVPFGNELAAIYRGVIDKVKRTGNGYSVRVGYVATNDVKLDEHGNEIPPTAAMASYYQTYILVKTANGYYVNGCIDG